MNWILHTLRNSFVYTGRSRRAEYGWFLLFNLSISLFFFILILASTLLGLLTLVDWLAALSSLISYLVIIPSLSLTARRLHDLDLSGWCQLIYIPFILANPILWLTVGGTSEAHITEFIEIYPLLTIVAGILMLFSFFLWFLLLFVDGGKTANKYGASPKYPDEQETAVQTL